ncbi:MAG: ATPase [Bacteroidaceae bacterium]|nr:ATPase [Bacteroidaceae bacterium]
MTRIIADSGSTKTDWSICIDNEVLQAVQTQGINPYHQPEEVIANVLEQEFLPALHTTLTGNTEVIFYGAGCANETACNRVRSVIRKVLGTDSIEVCTDLLGAARALCGHSEGIACVLGTGSNSCLFDGQRIVENVPPMGYILGDEGSSAALGKRLLSDVFKNQLPADLREEFLDKYQLTQESVLERVYRQPLVNRFLASFTPFLSEHRMVPEVHRILVSSFTEFLTRNVHQYHRPWLPINCVGSIAYVFAQEVKEAAEGLGMEMGIVMQSPMKGLIKYHIE